MVLHPGLKKRKNTAIVPYVRLIRDIKWEYYSDISP